MLELDEVYLSNIFFCRDELRRMNEFLITMLFCIIQEQNERSAAMVIIQTFYLDDYMDINMDNIIIIN
jgi:hypothetical protein